MLGKTFPGFVSPLLVCLEKSRTDLYKFLSRNVCRFEYIKIVPFYSDQITPVSLEFV